MALTLPQVAPERQALAELRAAMREHDLFSRPVTPIVAAFGAHLALAVGGALLIALVANPWFKVLGLMLSCMGMVGLGTVGHTASHQAAFSSKRWNKALFYACYPLMLMVSASYWHYSHVVRHHPAPNVVGVDADCDLRPVFAVTEEHTSGVLPLFRRWPTLQGLLLPLVLPFNGFSIQAQSWGILLRTLWKKPSRAAFADLSCMLSHLVINLGLPMLAFEPLAVLGVYAARVSLTGMGLFAVLAPGHFPAEAVALSEDQRKEGDFYLRQGATTVSFRTGWLGHFLCSGLEHQVEHHMFPSVSHVHLNKLQPMIERFCGEAGIPYHRMGWGEAILKSWWVFFRPKAIVSDVEGLRRGAP
ncbi:MAG: fatty acid desaturase [Alphaproteobacteria bacterium]|nr:fatty acid desaturase [Alphaproteobacteria bacterium]